MSEFARVLRAQVEHAHRELGAAWRGGNEERAASAAVRLAELLDLADRHGVDTTRWIDPAARSFLKDQRR
ncbi:MAG TPA: hypothetical protein VGH89_30125 [Pseudonocardia sp.]|jgi:hypothetical protein